ncbi:hypothetical protein KQ51_01668 [Candidatus Izimaplasma bacterium HR1]|jgi:transposase-like protein|uniref:hypothetical protein n=1 Tax=Candidatus Izimoplasma sp. HR1 TaxID=1541959 RepID=UPI0004F7C277|nr:hypothetical protein KQ51_01668 [Candidatus Izimaplasma bacterium HR1]
MSALQELTIEYDGMLGTIKQYSCDPYVVSYLNKLKSAMKSEDFEMIKIMINKLNEWYEENINAIEENRWVINVDSHHKTQRLLKEFMFKFEN